jgi:flagellar assembly protein FliH
MTPAKFHFDTEFRSGGDIVSQAARSRQKKSLTQEELDQHRADAHSEGARSGEVRALEAVAQGAREAAMAIRQALAQSHRDIEKIREDAARIAFVVARKLVPAALDALPAADVERALREAIHQAIGEPRIVLRASPRVIEVLNAHIAEIVHEEGYEGRVVAAPDPAILGADCRIEWRGGGAERSEAAMADALAVLIARRFSQSSHHLSTEE